ncbi:hypothetical protein [Modestobacter sp. SYSU DS0875]
MTGMTPVSDEEIFSWVRETLRDPQPVIEALGKLDVDEARALAHRVLSLLAGLVLSQEAEIHKLNEITDSHPNMPADQMAPLFQQWIGGVPLGMGGLEWLMQEVDRYEG